MYMLNFVDYVKIFGSPDWLNYWFFILGFTFTFSLIVMFLFYIGYKIYDFISIRISILILQYELKKLNKGSKK